MALTNYMMQSIIGIVVSYGVGLGYFGQLPLYMICIIGIIVLNGQILFNIYWLQKHRIGLVEMIWRRLSSGRKAA